ncbi:MAG: molybdopterin-dependent oxidoreductase, partial [Actinobacteria bacterium]|nr:molybdopterin-dependent oxidoreductase [Actinomycetota bacterium]
PVKLTGGDLPWQWEEDGLIATRSAAWAAPGCHDGCGVIIYTDQDGKFVKMEGDEDNPFYSGRLCARCLAIGEAINHPDRILYPMKRAYEDRGKDKWERISWDEAYDTIEKKFNQIRDEFGAECVVFHLGTGRGTAPYMTRLQYAFGSSNYAYMLSGNSCYVPRVAASNTLMGTYTCPDFSQYFIDRYEHDGWVAPKNIFVWGNNPLISNADGNMGHWVVDCMRRGSKLIVIDPTLTWLAARADLWLQIRPGTDAALALAMGKIIVEEDLYDHEFVDNWCYGFEEYAACTKDYDTKRVSEITWIPEEKIVKAAHMMAEKPSAVQWGLALDMTLECIAGSASVVSLWSITGQIDIPGGMITVHQPFNIQTWNPPDPAEHLTQQQQDARIGGKEYPMLKYSGVVLTQADMTVDQMLSNEPYPIKANWIQSTNPLACTAQEPETRMEPAYCNAEFNVMVDMFMTPTAMECCDIFLPITAFPERNGIRSIYYYVQNTNKAAKPLGETKSDMEICWELGRRWSTKAWPGESVEDFFTYTMEEVGMTFEESREENWIYPEYHYNKFRNGEQRPDGGLGFNTPTGRVELYSTMLQSWGQDPLPSFHEPPFGPVASPELMEKYPFVLTTGARQWASFHSEHRQIPHLRAIHPNPEFLIHPKPAAELGIQSGDWCYLENDLGTIRMVAKVTPACHERVISCDHAWWFPERNPENEGQGSYGVYDSNPNVLVKAQFGKTGFGNNCKSTVCKVGKIEGGE